jgi:hypothetical protein
MKEEYILYSKAGGGGVDDKKERSVYKEMEESI